MEVAAEATIDGRNGMLGVLYDEVARWIIIMLISACIIVRHRKHWAEYSERMGAGFQIDEVASKLNEDSLRYIIAHHQKLAEFAVCTGVRGTYSIGCSQVRQMRLREALEKLRVKGRRNTTRKARNANSKTMCLSQTIIILRSVVLYVVSWMCMCATRVHEVKCFHCKQKGHVQADCPLLKGGKGKSKGKCKTKGPQNVD